MSGQTLDHVVTEFVVAFDDETARRGTNMTAARSTRQHVLCEGNVPPGISAREADSLAGISQSAPHRVTPTFIRVDSSGPLLALNQLTGYPESAGRDVFDHVLARGLLNGLGFQARLPTALDVLYVHIGRDGLALFFHSRVHAVVVRYALPKDSHGLSFRLANDLRTIVTRHRVPDDVSAAGLVG